MIHRFSHGELIRVNRPHYVWNDYVTSSRIHTSKYINKYDLAIFIQFGGIEYDGRIGNNWKRDQWNLKVLSHLLGIVWVVDEYMDFV